MKHCLSLLLIFALLLSLGGCGRTQSPDEPVTVADPTAAPAAPSEAPPVSAQQPAAPTASSCGQGLSWKCEGGVLTISGQGAMEDYELLHAPWDTDGLSFGVTALQVEEGVTRLGAHAFAACCNLSEVSLPSTLRSVGAFAFADCVALRAVALPDSLLSIEDSAFSGSGLTALLLPEGLAQLGDHVFAFCEAMTEATVPDSLLTVGEGVFAGCDALTDIYMHDGAPAAAPLEAAGLGDRLRREGVAVPFTWEGQEDGYRWSLRQGVLHISGGSLPDFTPSGLGAAPWSLLRSTVEELVLEDAVSVGSYAFWDCSALKKATLPSSLAVIGDYAFGTCSLLSALELPNRLQSIGTGSFSFCQSLTSLTLPEGLTIIGEDAFRMCTAIQSFSAPGSVISVGVGAFAFGAEDVDFSAPAGSVAATAWETR